MIRTPRVVLGTALAILSLACRADGFVNVYEVPHNVSWNVIGNQLTHEIVNRHIGHWDQHTAKLKAEAAARAKGGKSAASAAAAGTGGAAGASAQILLPEQARQAEAAYRQAYGQHEVVIRKFGLPSGDLAVGMASAIAGAWMAFNNKSFPDQFYLPLVRQMRARVDAAAAAGQALSAAERKTAYEGLAITGMMLASSQVTWARDPRAAGAEALRLRMRAQGGEALEAMLKVAPERVAIGAEGVFALP